LEFQPVGCDAAWQLMVSEVQLKKAESPIKVTLLGIVMDGNEVHELKALSPIEVTLFGIVMDVNELQAAKAALPIEVTAFGTTNELAVCPGQ